MGRKKDHVPQQVYRSESYPPYPPPYHPHHQPHPYSGPPSAPVSQPTTNNIIVMGNDTRQMPQNIRRWTSGICGCCSDCSSCWCVLCCFPCVMCQMGSRMGENCCTAYLPGAFLAMRTKLRTMYGIRVSL